MNVWFGASEALLLLLVPAGVLVLRGTAVDRIVGLQLATSIAIVALLTIEQGLERQSFFDLSLALAVLSFPSTLLLARFYRRWL